MNLIFLQSLASILEQLLSSSQPFAMPFMSSVHEVCSLMLIDVKMSLILRRWLVQSGSDVSICIRL